MAWAEIYDPTSNSWSVTGSMTRGRAGHVAILLNDGRVLVAADKWGNRTAELYDPATGVWTVTSGPTALHQFGTASLLPDGRVLLASGFYGSPVVNGAAEIYDPATESWSFTGSLNVHRTGHTATPLADGRILVAGGNGSGGALTSAEIYDPTTGSWGLTGSLNQARNGHTATLLGNGQVLVAGRSNIVGSNPFTAELYNPATGLWSNAPDMPTGRALHTATLLNSGHILLAGGYDYATTSNLNSAILFTPDGVTPPSTSDPTESHIGDLDGTSFWVNSSRWRTTVTITVLDNHNNPVANATVSGNWSGGTSGSAICTTDGSGLCSVTSGNISKNKNSVTFTVSNISHATLAYDPAANSDLDGDSNGTVITMLKP